MQTIKPTEPTWVIAGNGVDLFLPCLVEPGQEFATGQPQLEQFTDRDSFLARLDALGIEYGESDYVPEIREVIPDWDAFNLYMLTDPMFKSYRDVVRGLDGDLNSYLSDAYGLVSTNGINAFALVWGVWVSVGGITPQDKEAIAGVAESYNLPADFVAVIRS